MNKNAGLQFSVRDTHLIKRFWLSAMYCLATILISDISAYSTKNLFSNVFEVVQNTPHETVLKWEFDKIPAEADHTVMLFAHGPVASASYFVETYQWTQTINGKLVANGDETNFPAEFQPRFPVIQLREIGNLAGSRTASFTIRFQLQDQLRQAGKDVMDVLSGTIRILYPQQDEVSFVGFSKALDEAAQPLFINYPPLRKRTETLLDVNVLPYLQSPSLKLHSTIEGLYRISGEELVSRLGMNPDTEEIALFQNRKAIPRIILDQNGNKKNSGVLLDGDSIYYFAPQSQSAFSPETVTWLSLHKGSVLQPDEQRDANANHAAHTAHHRIVLEKDVFHIEGRKRNEEQNRHWMWHSFEDGDFDAVFAIHEIIEDTTAIIRVNLDAKNDNYLLKPEHLYSVINTTPVTGEITHRPPNKFELNVQVPSSAFIEENTLSIIIDDDFQQSNTVALDKIEVYYPAVLQPSSQAYFNPAGVSGFSIPNEAQSVWGITTHQDGSNGYFNSAKPISISTENVDQFYVLPANPVLLSPTIETSLQPSQRTFTPMQSTQADVIILSPREWRGAFIPYQDELENQNLRSIFIAAEDVYDLYGNGGMSPFALRDFIRHAYQSWEHPKPSYILLAGDATWDYWGRYQNGIINNLPAYQGEGNYAIENWFVRCDDPDDKLPDIVIARIPVRTVDELNIVIQKTLSYRKNPPVGDWLNQMLVLTDDEFEEYTTELLNDWIPSGFQITERHVADYPLVDNIYLPSSLRQSMRAKTSLAATADILKYLNKGVFIWQFYGHGAPNVMGKQRLFFGGGSKFSDVKKLSAHVSPHILWSFSCETTRFDYPLDKWNISIGEDLLTLPNGGAVALMGAAGRGYPQDHIVLGRGLHEAAFSYGFSTFGLQYFSAQLMSLAFKPVFEPIDQFAIFGDPALPMPRFVELSGEIVENKNQYEYAFHLDDVVSYPIEAKLWVQNRDGTMQEMLKTVSVHHASPIQNSISKAQAKSFEDSKLGVHFIAKQDERIVVGHGAVQVPVEKTASEWIEPTTGVLPDIIFVEHSVTIKPDSPRSGETIFIEAEISNKGKASAKDFTIQGYQVDENGIESPMVVVVGERNHKVEQLNPNEKQTIYLRWDPTGNAGNNIIRIKADSDALIQEEDETNNIIEKTVSVLKKADLVIHPEHVSIIPAANNQQYKVSFKVINEGESQAERVLIECKVKINGQESILTLPINTATKTVTPAIISPQGAYSANEFGIPFNIDSFEILVDPDEVVDEETHENNRFLFKPGQSEL